MDVLVGSAASIRVDFLDPDGTLIPDAGSVSYTVRGTDGSLLIGSTAVVTTASDTGVTISVPANLITITGNRLFEKRTVIVQMTSGLRPYTYRKVLRVIPFINMTATPDDVRAVFGGSIDEIEDDEIDLVQAYFEVSDRVRNASAYSSLDTALASGTTVELFANEAIIGMAVLDLVTSLQARLPTMRRDGTSIFQRQTIDFDAIAETAGSMVARGVAAAAGVTFTAPSLLAVSCSPDPVTYWNGQLSFP